VVVGVAENDDANGVNLDGVEDFELGILTVVLGLAEEPS